VIPPLSEEKKCPPFEEGINRQEGVIDTECVSRSSSAGDFDLSQPQLSSCDIVSEESPF
jgi:hypothetical protein